MAAGLTLAAGCAKSEKVEVVGTVTLNGKPIEDGDISFFPDQGGSGAQSSAPIKAGKYRVGGEWGLAAGTYQVRINAYRAPANKAAKLPGGLLDMPPETPGIPSREQFLPKRFNTESTIEPLTVPPGQSKVERNFDLKE